MRRKQILDKALFSKLGEEYRSVDLPHTWNAIDGQDGGGDYHRGIGSYILELPDRREGKRMYIEFQGANHVATVYSNGTLLGTHEGGFSTFRFDLTDTLKKSGNTLSVDVSNARSDIYPQSADFTFFGGLYRQVSIIEVEEAHFDLLLDGTDGVFVTPFCTGRTRIDLFTVASDGCRIKVAIKDEKGNTVQSGECMAERHSIVNLSVASPRLWDGIKDPYLYTLNATLERDGEIVDEVSVSYGYRSFHVESDNGFFLNGVRMPLRGVSRHQDKLDKGWALSREDHEEDIAIIKEMGANSIRLAHYQHDQYFYDLCDRTGFVIWAEIPFISVFNRSKKAYDNTISQMRELIGQNYNHPSILFWGISNEITIGGESDALYMNLTKLNSMAKAMDPIRLTTMAEVSMLPKDSEHVYITDVLGYNHYFGWYVGDVEDNASWIDDFHKSNPDRPLGISEYGAEAVLSWHSAFPENHDYTEEYAAYYHHQLLKIFEKRPFLWSTYVWNMFDFASDARNEGGIKGRNNKGLVTYDRKVRKQAFYIYKAYWNSEPMVYVAGERFVNRAPDERDITVYSNCDRVTLIVNGVELAEKDVVDHMAVFENVPLERGANKISARADGVEGNEIVLNGVDEHDYRYDLPFGNEGANWFDDPEALKRRKRLAIKNGFLSIKDKLGTLLSDPEAKAIVAPLLTRIGQENAMMGDVMSSDGAMHEFMMRMRLDDLLKMASGTLPDSFRESLNEELQKIRKH